MSEITRAFQETRIEYGLKQKPNWSGTVYGACMSKGCGNYRKIAYYVGGFCKLCSQRHPDDKKLPVISAPNTPNPRIRWIQGSKTWVKDMSHTLSPQERKAFYTTPEQQTRQTDRIDYSEPEEEDTEESGQGDVRPPTWDAVLSKYEELGERLDKLEEKKREA